MGRRGGIAGLSIPLWTGLPGLDSKFVHDFALLPSPDSVGDIKQMRPTHRVPTACGKPRTNLKTNQWLSDAIHEKKDDLIVAYRRRVIAYRRREWSHQN